MLNLKNNWYWILFSIIIFGGIGVFMFTRLNSDTKSKTVYNQPSEETLQNIQDKLDVQKAKFIDGSKRQPAGETHETGFWENSRWHRDPIEISKVLKEDTVQNTVQIGVDWNSLSLEERRERWAKPYRAKWGDEPPWNSEYRHVHDSKGKVRRHYRNKPLVKQYETRRGFAPTPAALERYLTLKTDYNNAEAVGDFPKAATLLEEMQNIVHNNQGELPVRPFGITYYGDSFPQEVQLQLNKDAVKELYAFMGIIHLYEFYEK
ncbi:hypothetical protein JT359_15470 [Candidatus Poribacteria bacterium]|nr:hypothetical protein [Candidatus Poribacteria bacterium]